MRKALILLAPLLLAGCVRESASYYINGNVHTLSVRAEQEYFWDKTANVKLVMARLPDCQRQLALAKLPLSELAVELFAVDDNVFTLRAGQQVWQVETTGCTRLGEPAPTAYGTPVGVFKLDDDKRMVFEKVAVAASPAALQP